MIVLDTNVLSEPLKHEPSSAVLDWLKLQHRPVFSRQQLLMEFNGCRMECGKRNF
jgi:predicted nucleic acid-binding protein